MYGTYMYYTHKETEGGLRICTLTDSYNKCKLNDKNNIYIIFKSSEQS
jgi:hypothetical protein